MLKNLFHRLIAPTDFGNQLLVLAKPDAVSRGQVGSILMMFETKRFSIRDTRELQMSRGFCVAHYRDHIDKPFFKNLVDFMSSGLTIGFRMQWMGLPEEMIPCARDQVAIIRTNCVNPQNRVHASDSIEAAQRELALWFPNSRN